MIFGGLPFSAAPFSTATRIGAGTTPSVAPDDALIGVTATPAGISVPGEIVLNAQGTVLNSSVSNQASYTSSSFSVSGDYLAVVIHTSDVRSGTDISSVTYGGQAMTRLAATAYDGSNNRPATFVYGLANPPAGSNTATVNISGTPNAPCMALHYYDLSNVGGVGAVDTDYAGSHTNLANDSQITTTKDRSFVLFSATTRDANLTWGYTFSDFPDGTKDYEDATGSGATGDMSYSTMSGFVGSSGTVLQPEIDVSSYPTENERQARVLIEFTEAEGVTSIAPSDATISVTASQVSIIPKTDFQIDNAVIEISTSSANIVPITTFSPDDAAIAVTASTAGYTVEEPPLDIAGSATMVPGSGGTVAVSIDGVGSASIGPDASGTVAVAITASATASLSPFGLGAASVAVAASGTASLAPYSVGVGSVIDIPLEATGSAFMPISSTGEIAVGIEASGSGSLAPNAVGAGYTYTIVITDPREHFVVAAENRNFVVQGEQRDFVVQPDDTAFQVEQEANHFIVEYESRDFVVPVRE